MFITGCGSAGKTTVVTNLLRLLAEERSDQIFYYLPLSRSRIVNFPTNVNVVAQSDHKYYCGNPKYVDLNLAVKILLLIQGEEQTFTQDEAERVTIHRTLAKRFYNSPTIDDYINSNPVKEEKVEKLETFLQERSRTTFRYLARQMHFVDVTNTLTDNSRSWRLLENYLGFSLNGGVVDSFFDYEIEFNLGALGAAKISLENTTNFAAINFGDIKEKFRAKLSIAKNTYDLDVSNFNHTLTFATSITNTETTDRTKSFFLSIKLQPHQSTIDKKPIFIIDSLDNLMSIPKSRLGKEGLELNVYNVALELSGETLSRTGNPFIITYNMSDRYIQQTFKYHQFFNHLFFEEIGQDLKRKLLIINPDARSQSLIVDNETPDKTAANLSAVFAAEFNNSPLNFKFETNTVSVLADLELKAVTSATAEEEKIKMQARIDIRDADLKDKQKQLEQLTQSINSELNVTDLAEQITVDMESPLTNVVAQANTTDNTNAIKESQKTVSDLLFLLNAATKNLRAPFKTEQPYRSRK